MQSFDVDFSKRNAPRPVRDSKSIEGLDEPDACTPELLKSCPGSRAQDLEANTG